MFTQQLASLLIAGLPLVQCLEALQDQTEDAAVPHHHPRRPPRHLRRVIPSPPSVKSSRARSRRCSSRWSRRVRRAAAWPRSSAKVAGYFESTVKLTKKVKSAMAYPIGVIAAGDRAGQRPAHLRHPGVRRHVRGLRRQAAGPDPAADRPQPFHGQLVVAHRHPRLRRILVDRSIASSPPRTAAASRTRPSCARPIFGNLIHKIALSRFCRTYATLIRSGVPDPAHARDRGRGQQQGADRGRLRGNRQVTSAKVARSPRSSPPTTFSRR